MVIFKLEQAPDMGRGSGVRLRRFEDGGLSDLKTFKAETGLTWTDTAGREFSLTGKEYADGVAMPGGTLPRASRAPVGSARWCRGGKPRRPDGFVTYAWIAHLLCLE